MAGLRNAYLERQTGIWPLLSFRVLFGLVVCFGAVRFMAEGWVETLLVATPFKFSFWGFDWLPRPGRLGAYLLYGTIALSSLAVSLGWRYRLSLGLMILSFSYAELLDATHYLNHYYLVILLAALLMLSPAHAICSLDVKAGRVAARAMIPAWCRDVLLLQLGLVYFFAGLAKLNPDWLFRAMPLAVWLPERSEDPILGWLFSWSWAPWIFSWMGFLYDLTIAFWLRWKLSRPWAYMVVLLFHGLTWYMFNIGLFPLIMSTATLLFFSADRHKAVWYQLFEWIGRPLRSEFSWVGLDAKTRERRQPYRQLLSLGLLVWFAIQVALPLRSVLYPGNVHWSEQGYRFSWRVMLVEKSGLARFTVLDAKTGLRVEINNRDFLSEYQEKQMAIQPDFIRQFAVFLAQEYRERGFANPQVFAEAYVSLNARRSQLLVDPQVDLAAVSNGLGPQNWILPLE